MPGDPRSDTTLREVVPDSLWHAQQLLSVGPVRIATRMSIVKLADGALWVHSPIAPRQELVTQISRLGPVSNVVAPNKSHHLFFLPFLEAFPGAQGWIAPGLETKRKDLSGYPVLGEHMPWEDDLSSSYIRGIPLLNETVWFHRKTGTLLLTDLLFCIAPNPDWIVRNIARLLGVYGQLGMSRTMKLAIRDRDALAASVSQLLRLPVQRVVMAHDQIVEDRVQEKLQHAFAFLQIGNRSE